MVKIMTKKKNKEITENKKTNKDEEIVEVIEGEIHAVEGHPDMSPEELIKLAGKEV